MINLEEVTFSQITEYGSIGIIGLGRDFSNKLEKVDFIASDKIIVLDSHEINYKLIKQLSAATDVIFIAGNLEETFVDKFIWDIVSYLKSLNANLITIIKNAKASLEVMQKVKNYFVFLDLDRQENSDLMWTLKSLYRVIYYHNDEYNFKDANYPVNKFWKAFFQTNSQVFFYQSSSVSIMLEKMKMNNIISEQMNISKYCLLAPSSMANYEIETLVDKIENELDEDAYLYIKNEKSNSTFDNLIMFLGV